METMELAVYLFAAIAVGGMLVFAIKSVDHEKNYRQTLDALRNREGEEYKITKDKFAEELAKRWESCRMGIDNMSTSVYVIDNGTLERSQVILELKRNDKCDTIDCNNKSGRFEMPANITIPKIINIQCFNSSLVVS